MIGAFFETLDRKQGLRLKLTLKYDGKKASRTSSTNGNNNSAASHTRLINYARQTTKRWFTKDHARQEYNYWPTELEDSYLV